MKHLLTLLFLLQTMTLGAQPLFNDGWRFRFADEAADYSAASLSCDGWTAVTLPHTPRYENYNVVRQWQGICWYRKEFGLDAAMRGKRCVLTFEGAMNIADIWINGVHREHHLGGYLPIVIDITDDLHKGTNSIAVRLDNRDCNITGPKPVALLDYFLYGGLYRNVRLEFVDEIRITDPFLDRRPAAGGVFVTYDNVSNTSADVNVQVSVANGTRRRSGVKVVNELLDGSAVVAVADGSAVVEAGGVADVNTGFKVENPRLWSPSSPNLYTLRTTLYAGDRKVGEQSRRIGIRSIEIRDRKLYVNGRPTFLRGVNRHQCYPYVGIALSDNAQRRDAVKIKESGFDYVRLSHYPQSPAFLDACDSLGLFVLDAISGWQFFDKSEEFAEYHRRSARELIRRDRNRPCVLAWELSLNETAMPRSFIEDMNDIFHEEYPARYGYTAGWKYGYDIYIEARQYRIKHAVKGYDAPLIVSEYGDWEFYAIDDGFMQHKTRWFQKPELTSRQLREYGEKRMLQQVDNIALAHRDNRNNVPAMADGYWVMFDYNRGLAPDLVSSGVMSLERLPKYACHYFRSLRENGEPMIFVASNFDRESGDSVTVFSNCEQARFWLDGEEIGGCSFDRRSVPAGTIARIYVGDRRGELTARGYVGGREVASHTVRTPGKPSSIRLACDEGGVKLGRNDMIFVHVHLTDRNGTTIFENGGEVFLAVEGDASIAGSAVVPFRGGIASFLVKTGTQGGDVVLSAQYGKFKTETKQNF